MSRRSPKQVKLDHLVDEFRRNGTLDRAFDHLAARRLGVNLTDLDCLSAIQRRGGLTAGELAAEAGLTSGAITGVIDRLERAGFARRERDPEDRRRVTVAVTPAFYERAAAIWGPVKEEWDTTVGGRFTAEQLDVVIAFLEAANAVSARHVQRLADT